jgi:hypothetical protein
VAANIRARPLDTGHAKTIVMAMPGSTLGLLAVAVAAYCVPLLAQAQPKGAGELWEPPKSRAVPDNPEETQGS